MDVVGWEPGLRVGAGLLNGESGCWTSHTAATGVEERVSATLHVVGPGRNASSSAARLTSARGSDARRHRVRVGGAQRFRLAKEPCSWRGCASRATLHRQPAERSPAVKGGPTGPSTASRVAAPLTAGRSGATQACRTASGRKLTTSMPREPVPAGEPSAATAGGHPTDGHPVTQSATELPTPIELRVSGRAISHPQRARTAIPSNKSSAGARRVLCSRPVDRAAVTAARRARKAQAQRPLRCAPAGRWMQKPVPKSKSTSWDHPGASPVASRRPPAARADDRNALYAARDI